MRVKERMWVLRHRGHGKSKVSDEFAPQKLSQERDCKKMLMHICA